jgi:hypothetical protein
LLQAGPHALLAHNVMTLSTSPQAISRETPCSRALAAGKVASFQDIILTLSNYWAL